VREARQAGIPPTEGLTSVVIATRDRGALPTVAVRSVLAPRNPDLEVIVVDQSTGDATERALEPLAGDSRLRYMRSASRGVSHARNLGIEQAREGIVVCIDDDCEAEPGWLEAFEAAFRLDPRIGVVAGIVRAAPHDGGEIVPAYYRDEPYLARSVREKHRVEGLSACMAMRRAAWKSLGGFDPMLGAGAPFRSGAESDFVLRALESGWWVYETPAASVIHYGFRSGDEARELIRSYWFGTGAMLVKNLRRGCWDVFFLLGRLAVRWAVGRPPVDIGRRRHRWLRLCAFVLGGFRGATTPLAGEAGHFANLKAGPTLPS
jgi:GT2 family glycosyltransferase